MYKITNVYIPINRNKNKEEFRKWCITNISPYSTEITWILEEKLKNRFLVFCFFKETDASAFRLTFGL